MDLAPSGGSRPWKPGSGRSSSLDVSAPGRRGSGFTLIELLVTIVIVGILAAIAVPQYQETSRRAHEAAAMEDLRNLMTAEEIFHHRNDRYSDGTQAGPGDPVLDENGDVLIRTSQGGRPHGHGRRGRVHGRGRPRADGPVVVCEHHGRLGPHRIHSAERELLTEAGSPDPSGRSPPRCPAPGVLSVSPRPRGSRGSGR